MTPESKLLDPVRWFTSKRAQACVDALKARGFAAYYTENREQAVKLVEELIPPGASVGIGGSVTVRQLGLPKLLKERGHKIYDHWDPDLTPAQKQEARDNQIKADVFLSSTNAVTMDGVLVNTDGSGNRVTSMIVGPKITIVVCGTNKIVDTVEDGLRRIRTFAAPVNYRRLNMVFPCQEGKPCHDCKGATGCRITTIVEAPPPGKEKFAVIIVGERLGY